MGGRGLRARLVGSSNCRFFLMGTQAKGKKFLERNFHVTYLFKKAQFPEYLGKIKIKIKTKINALLLITDTHTSQIINYGKGKRR